MAFHAGLNLDGGILGSQDGNTTQRHKKAQLHLILPAICKQMTEQCSPCDVMFIVIELWQISAQLTRYGYCNDLGNDYGLMSTIFPNLPKDIDRGELCVC